MLHPTWPPSGLWSTGRKRTASVCWPFRNWPSPAIRARTFSARTCWSNPPRKPSETWLHTFAGKPSRPWSAPLSGMPDACTTAPSSCMTEGSPASSRRCFCRCTTSSMSPAGSRAERISWVLPRLVSLMQDKLSRWLRISCLQLVMPHLPSRFARTCGRRFRRHPGMQSQGPR